MSLVSCKHLPLSSFHFPSVCLSVCLFVCLSVCLFVCMSVCLLNNCSFHFLWNCNCLAVNFSVFLSVSLKFLSVCLSVCLFPSFNNKIWYLLFLVFSIRFVGFTICLFVYLSLCMFNCLSVSLFVILYFFSYTINISSLLNYDIYCFLSFQLAL